MSLDADPDLELIKFKTLVYFHLKDFEERHENC